MNLYLITYYGHAAVVRAFAPDEARTLAAESWGERVPLASLTAEAFGRSDGMTEPRVILSTGGYD